MANTFLSQPKTRHVNLSIRIGHTSYLISRERQTIYGIYDKNLRVVCLIVKCTKSSKTNANMIIPFNMVETLSEDQTLNLIDILKKTSIISGFLL